LPTASKHWWLYRVGQGLFGATIMPMGQGIVLATFPRQLHAAVMVIWGAGSVMGAGVRSDHRQHDGRTYNWRAAFFMIVPPGIVALVCVWFALSNTRRGRGSNSIGPGFSPCRWRSPPSADARPRQRLDWFESPEICLDAGVAVIAFWIFLAHSLTASRPFSTRSCCSTATLRSGSSSPSSWGC